MRTLRSKLTSCFILLVAFFLYGNGWAQTNEKSDATPLQSTKLGARLDCLHDFNLDKGSKQPCMTISGLRLDYSQKVSDEMHANIRLDPFGTTSESYENSPKRDQIPSISDTKLLLVDHYSFVWIPRPNLEIALEDYGGAAKIPSMSGLAFGNSLVDNGWNQTALSVTYNLSAFEKMAVKFSAGNGEGENAENLDPQQYFGLEVKLYFVPGFLALMGFSFDGNNVGSRAHEWELKKIEDEQGVRPIAPGNVGYSTQRAAFSLALDGKLAVARGLRLAVGWHRSTLRDLNKKVTFMPSPGDLQNNCNPILGTPDICKSYDVGTLFIEDPTGEKFNTVEREVWVFNGSYRILDRYFVGLYYEARHVDMGFPFFQVCNQWTGLKCDLVGEERRRIMQTSIGVGGGFNLSDNIALTVEYSAVTYDKLYKQAFYEIRNDRTAKDWDAVNMRVAYNWE